MLQHAEMRAAPHTRPQRLRKGPSGCQAAWLNMAAFLAELPGQAPSLELDDVSWEGN